MKVDFIRKRIDDALAVTAYASFFLGLAIASFFFVIKDHIA